MKIRTGFVSNSSSSSFIVAFPKDMEVTSTNVQQYLFGENRNIRAYDSSISAHDAADRICADMLAQTPNDNEQILESLGGWLDGSPDYDDFKIPENGKRGYDLQVDWEKYGVARDLYAKNYADKFIKEVGPDMDIYTFVFSDYSCDEGVLEHGGTFDRTEHITVSNH